jgi:hypothetical protein
MGALSAGLALPFSFLAHAGPFDGRPAAASSVPISGIEAAADESVLSRWHDYALSSITPQFSWAVLPASYGAPRVLDNYSGDVEKTPLFEARNAAATHLGISVASGTVADTPSVLPNQTERLIGLPQPGLQRTVIAPTLAHDWGDRGSVRLTGVLAYQRFASLGLGTTGADAWAPLSTRFGDSSYGAGARVDVSNALGDRLRWNLGYQSRVGMSAFANYRGVFADPGDFDIPASATANISYALTPDFGMDVGVQRVMYSAITPFTSANLPTRFLALLGDGSSPVFAWRDLNVYSVGWTVHDADIGSVVLRYTTRQQPIPTSTLLANALASATANDTISLGWSRGFGARSNLSFLASYATSSYYLLMPSYLARSDGTASQFEFEALWSTHF